MARFRTMKGTSLGGVHRGVPKHVWHSMLKAARVKAAVTGNDVNIVFCILNDKSWLDLVCEGEWFRKAGSRNYVQKTITAESARRWLYGEVKG